MSTINKIYIFLQEPGDPARNSDWYIFVKNKGKIVEEKEKEL